MMVRCGIERRLSSAWATGALALACTFIAGCDGAPKVAAVPHSAVVERAPLAAIRPALSPFSLVGTVIQSKDRFAMLRENDGTRRTVRAGEQIDGYTVGDIESDRIHIHSARDGDQIVIASAGNEAEQVETPPAPLPVGALIKNVNLDQSIPKDVRWGPTAAGPDGNKQVGH